MKWQGVNELREKYLSFFESKGHTRLPSFSLIPQGDKSLLLINSGMAPLKKYFLGQAVPPNTRVTTCQKCIRTPDIERVGQTARHGTYFEMLGNFSFGDYFKIEAITWAWEFFTKVLEMPADKLYVSVFENDDEAFEMWTKQIGVAEDHMVRLGREDNFWEHGSGPCGPCSEIYFDRGPEKGCGKPDCHVGCDCDRYVEVWNLVFSQFDSDGNGHYTEMEHKNIDTGMGLERLACVMQGVDNLFEVDTVQNIMKHVCRIAGVTYNEDEKVDVALRVITDHIRSTTFMIGDGVMPSNAGRGYVLRRLLRRAARYGRLIGIEKPFLYEVVETVIHENASAYPELEEKKAYIRKIVEEEEKTLTLVSSRQHRIFKLATVWLSAVVALLLLPLIYLVFFQAPFKEKLLQADTAYLKVDYTGVIDELEGVAPSSLPTTQKYELATSYLQGLNFSEDQKKVILNNVTLKSDSLYLHYWIYIGRHDFTQALDTAKRIDDSDLIIYALRKEIKATRDSEKLSGEQREKKLSELEGEYKKYWDARSKLLEAETDETKASTSSSTTASSTEGSSTESSSSTTASSTESSDHKE